MKVNIPIELNEEERKTLGVALHGKVKAITRKEVVSIVDQLIHYLANKNYDSVDNSIGWVLNFYPKSIRLKSEKKS